MLFLSFCAFRAVKSRFHNAPYSLMNEMLFQYITRFETRQFNLDNKNLLGQYLLLFIHLL